jgi:hypothetical protein
MDNFVKRVLNAGGSITPLIIPADVTNGTGIFNPAICNDNGKLICNIRHAQVTIFHSEKSKFEHQWGPLTYMNPENDITLTTTNYFCEIGDDMLIKSYHKVDMSKLDTPPLWEFRGLEDGRLVRWDGKLYLAGVRRDTTTNGQGRMELSEIQFDDNGVREISRFRIPAPGADNTYCEKNWMPVLDKPYHFVKWSNPTQVVYADPIKKTCENVYVGEVGEQPYPYDYRGGSQVVKIGDYYVCVTHQTHLFKSEKGSKNGIYKHAFIVWDKNWKVLKYCKPFSFFNVLIEFCAGMCVYGENVLITFGSRDNAAYLLRIPLKAFEDFINE